MDTERQFKIAVLGSGSARDDSPEAILAYKTGAEIAKRSGILLTGGCPGLPNAAVLGARSVNGLTLAISPAKGRSGHDEGYGYPLNSHATLYTGMGRRGRNLILVRSADACVFVGGGMGTLNEFTIAFDDLGPESAIGILRRSGGIADEIPKIASIVGRTPQALMVEDADPETLLDKVFQHLSKA